MDTNIRFAYSPAEAAQLLGLSRKGVYDLMSSGQLRSTNIGKSRRIPVTELRRLAGLDTAVDASADIGGDT